METSRYFLYLFTIINSLGWNSVCQAGPGPNSHAAVPNLHFFSRKVLLQSEFNFVKFSKGAVVTVPFSIGYTLANINVVLNKINPSANQEAFQNVVQDYSILVELLNNSNMTTWSGVFLRPNDSSTPALKLSQDFKRLKTDVRDLEIAEDPEPNEFNPGSFPFTTSTLLHYNHYKGTWNKRWTNIGDKKFSDGSFVPFQQIEEALPIKENDQLIAVAVKLKDDKKYLVLVLPKANSGAKISQDFSWMVGYPAEHWSTNKTRKIQCPVLNFTLFAQPFWKFVDVGLPARICPDEAFKDSSKKPAVNAQDVLFSGPIVHSNRVRLDSDGLEIETEAGAGIYSEAKLNSFLVQNGGLRGFEGYLHKFLNVSLDLPTINKNTEIHKQRQKRSAKLTDSDVDTIQFNRPFFWYLVDGSLGPLYYGAVESFESYKRESNVEPELKPLVRASSARASFCPQLFKSRE